VPERFYCPDLPSQGIATLQGDQAHHLIRVRRVEPGAVVELFDGRGMGFLAEVSKLGKQEVELVVRDPLPDRRPAVELTLATAVPKGERFDWLVEKATELGVARLVPIRTSRSSVDPRGSKLDRLRRVIVEAAKQCGRNRLMELANPADWREYVTAEDAPCRLLADPGGEPWPDGRGLAIGARAAVAIGPEGGFTPAELALAREASWRGGRLVPTILRIETAALAASALVLAFHPAENPS
jgi:16S rRNA (uracil1498-N3)-methyltransferase